MADFLTQAGQEIMIVLKLSSTAGFPTIKPRLTRLDRTAINMTIHGAHALV
jgi:hypothetical protein